MDWLTPDWTCSPQRGGVLVEHDCLRQSRPEIKLQVSRVEHGAWDLFKKHHYLTENVNKSCKFFLFTWDDRPVGMVAAINQPGAGDRRNAMALSRTVVLPDFQGLGIGKAISSFTASMLTSEGRKIYMKTIHPALGEYRERSDDYRPTAANGKIGAEDKMVKRKMRVSYCHQYVGEPTFGYDELTKTVGEMRANKKKNSPQLDLGL